MTVHRQHDDLFVALTTNGGTITRADLRQDRPGLGVDVIEISPTQLYALVDDVAVADPETWAKKFPQEEEAERALRRVAVYFKERARVNRIAAAGSTTTSGRLHYSTMADAFDLAVTAVMEEIEALYPTVPDEITDPTQALNNYHARS